MRPHHKLVLSHQLQPARLMDGQLRDEARICPEPAGAPERLLSLERLHAGEPTLVPLHRPERPLPCQPSRSSLFFHFRAVRDLSCGARA